MKSKLWIAGQAISLDHLSPVSRDVKLELRGNITKVVKVEFGFSCHCYSRGLAAGEAAPAGHEVPDGSDHMPRPRAFDLERYALSFKLVALIDALIATNGVVTKSRHENFFRVDDMEVERGGVLVAVPYFIFMHARKVAMPNQPKFVRVFVESAYAEQNGIPHPHGKGSGSFGRMLGAVWG